MKISKQIKSKISKDGKLTISIDNVEVPEPNEGEVLLKVQATPINPSDLGLLVGPADVSSLKYALCGSAPLPQDLFKKFEASTGIKIII